MPDMAVKTSHCLESLRPTCLSFARPPVACCNEDASLPCCITLCVHESARTVSCGERQVKQ